MLYLYLIKQQQKPKAMNAQTNNIASQTTIASGNTFAARESLKKAGFEFMPYSKEWMNTNFNAEEWQNKYCNPTYVGRKIAAINQAVKMTTTKR